MAFRLLDLLQSSLPQSAGDPPLTGPNAGLFVPTAGVGPANTGIQPPVVSPLPQQNQVDSLGRRSAQDIARRMVEAHKRGLIARRQRDLTAEKFILHIDGAADFQWADIFHGARVEIPRIISEFRKQENLLRPIVDNAVAHHTTMPLRFFADSSPDRRARNSAMIDAIWANYLAEQQDLNALSADALYLAMASGFCPLHAYWREDINDQYEPIDATSGSRPTPGPGMIDMFVGNPFDTVFDRSARRGSVYWSSYGRLLPADIVRQAFDHVQGINSLQGSIRIPSASLYQRVARDWRVSELGMHGTSVIDLGRGYQEGEEEMLTLLCREVAPGIDAQWPQGRLQIVAVPGEVDFRRNQGNPSHALLLADQPLPAGDFSWSLIYSHHRGDDVLGKPWVEDLDDLQVDLNIALSKRWEHALKMAEAPIVGPGGALGEDMMDIGGYNYMEIEPSLAAWRPRVMEWPSEIIQALSNECNEKRTAMYTIGGYQAASRGQAPGSRTAYRAILALQQADDTIHGPVNARFRRSLCDFMVKCWKQMKVFGSVPWLIDIVGDEYAYLVDPYVSSQHLSEKPPKFKLVNAFGPNPELRAQEVLDLVTLRGADGQVFLTTDEARRQYPNQTIFDSQGDPKSVQKRRARTIATAFSTFANQFRQHIGQPWINPPQPNQPLTSPADPKVQQAAMWVFAQIETKYPRLQDDDLTSHLNTLSEIVQDETADPIARLAAMKRQQLYFQWQASMAGPGMVGKGPNVNINIKGELDPVQSTQIATQEGFKTPPPNPALLQAANGGGGGGPPGPGGPPAGPGGPMLGPGGPPPGMGGPPGPMGSGTPLGSPAGRPLGTPVGTPSIATGAARNQQLAARVQNPQPHAAPTVHHSAPRAVNHLDVARQRIAGHPIPTAPGGVVPPQQQTPPRAALRRSVRP